MRQAQRGHRAATQALFGHKVQAQRAPRARVQARHVNLTHANGPGGGAHVFTRQRQQQFLLPIARHAGNAHHLARAHVKGDAVQVHAKLVFTRQRQTPHAQHARTGIQRTVH